MHAARLALPTPLIGHLLALLLPPLTALTITLPPDGFTRALKPLTRHVPVHLPTLLALLDAALLAPAVLGCTLEARWQALFVAHDAAAVRAVQDALACCGLRSVVDRAFPFPGGGRDARACTEAYGREAPCGPRWAAEARVVLGVWIAVGAGGLVVKVLALVLARRRGEGGWYRGAREEGRRERAVGAIESGGPRESEEGARERLLEETGEETPLRA